MLFPRDEAIRSEPIFEEVVKQQTRSVGRSMCCLFVAVSDAMTNRQHDEGSFTERCRCFSQLSKDAHQIPTRRIQGLQLGRLQVAVREWEGVLGDGNDGLVFGKKKPVPDALG